MNDYSMSYDRLYECADKMLCVVPDKGEDNLMARLNDKLRAIGLG